MLGSAMQHACTAPCTCQIDLLEAQLQEVVLGLLQRAACTSQQNLNFDQIRPSEGNRAQLCHATCIYICSFMYLPGRPPGGPAAAGSSWHAACSARARLRHKQPHFLHHNQMTPEEAHALIYPATCLRSFRHLPGRPPGGPAAGGSSWPAARSACADPCHNQPHFLHHEERAPEERSDPRRRPCQTTCIYMQLQVPARSTSWRQLLACCMLSLRRSLPGR